MMNYSGFGLNVPSHLGVSGAETVAARLAQAKWAFTTRRVDRATVRSLITDFSTKPRAGDLVLARVLVIGHHTTIELPTGRKAVLHPGDEIVVSYGNRYAPDQFEAFVPQDLGEAHLVAGGGIAARAVLQHEKVNDPTTIEPIGLLATEDGRRLNLAQFAMKRGSSKPIPAIAVFGTSMNSGKTTTVAYLVRGLTRAGLKVGAAKITGTGAGNDLWSMRDAGAIAAYDFTDAGMATTYLSPVQSIVEGASVLLGALAAEGADVAVIEIADGLFQEETAAIANHRDFKAMISSCVFAAGDAMGALAGVSRLKSLGHSVCAVSGLVTRSPLGMREAEAIGLPVLTRLELADPDVAEKIFFPHLHRNDLLLARTG